MSTLHALPTGFEALEPFVEYWAAATCVERDELRGGSSAEAKQTFFKSGAPLVTQATAYLDTKPLSELDAADKRLLNLLLSLSHIQMSVEVHREMEPQHALARKAMIITRSVSDL